MSLAKCLFIGLSVSLVLVGAGSQFGTGSVDAAPLARTELSGPHLVPLRSSQWEPLEKRLNQAVEQLKPLAPPSSPLPQSPPAPLKSLQKRQDPQLDPCTILGGKVEPDITYSMVRDCYHNVPLNKTEANNALSTLYTLFRDYYIFLDYSRLDHQEKPYTNPGVDILSELDRMGLKLNDDGQGAGEGFKNDFDFQTKMDLLVNRLNDAHANYLALCYRKFLYTQPFELYAPVINNKQSLRILRDNSDQGLEDCEILSINGVLGLDAVQSWVDTHFGYSKDRGVRLNKALSGMIYNAQRQEWVLYPGQFTSRSALPEDEVLNYRIQCPPSEAHPQGRDETIEGEWNVFRLVTWQSFDDTESYLRNNCYSDTDPTVKGNLQKRDEQDHLWQTWRRLERRQSVDGALDGKTRDADAEYSLVAAAVEIPRDATLMSLLPPAPASPLAMPGQKRQDGLSAHEKRQDDSTQDGILTSVADLVYNSTSMAFYQLKNFPKVGVVVIPTHMISLSKEGVEFGIGFERLDILGVENIILDMTGNGGGYVNFAYDLIDSLFPPPKNSNPDQEADEMDPEAIGIYWASVYQSDLRTSSSIMALAQADFVNKTYTSYFNPESYFNPVTGYEFEDNFFLGGHRERRVHSPIGYTSRVWMYHNPMYLPLDRVRINKNPTFIVLTDGACGSACGMSMNRLKNRHGLKSYAVGGRHEEDLSLFSFAGASVYSLDEILNDFDKLGVDPPMRRMRYKGIYRVPVMEFFWEDNPVPIEYNPKLYKADFHLDYTPETAAS
ncbi:hypothetical protein BGW38_007162 [Lunasporangiospora selenospora]|uniref:Tail specific protease domain-containing protein n=1 Tax=Lunasporangiospora selenospora TaxID=979761 RepID=A0A9P6FYN6_9FUNG|nr:hypothetical protein BGW38_007162 [Lunasporangiospora selenospora]